MLMKPAFLLFAACLMVLAAGGCTPGSRAIIDLATSPEALKVVQLEANAAREPLGMDDPTPRLSWRIESAEAGVKQHSFRVLVATSEHKLEEGAADVWDSRDVVSSDPFVVYAGPGPSPRTRYFWTVRVSSTDGAVSGWSGPSWFETALLDVSQWQADWIAGPERSMDRNTPEGGGRTTRR